MTSKELIQKLDSHMRVNKITRKSVADKLGVSSAEVGRKLAADNCGLREFIALLDVVGVIWIRTECTGVYNPFTDKHHMNGPYYRLILDLKPFCVNIVDKLETSPSKVKRMLASENMKLSTFLKLTEAAVVTNDYFKFY